MIQPFKPGCDCHPADKVEVPSALVDDATFDLPGMLLLARDADALAERRRVAKEPGPYVFSVEVPANLAGDAAFRNVFEAILEGLEMADREGLGAPYEEEAEGTALYVWGAARGER